ncbi:hypothetical protein DS2_05895 [Catenovulum agarivorans DS-2]|uniref:Iron uptake protein n=1 Tax=Catenovulum agarivorans DS-2 TaxID=1328313 RepID=W7QQ38_9ALTE|nr:hypothetical protein [Catenovulum agarivorans]EWH11077.1 hypothetical protein DS2_05895 [Catenovulum agarivorans DS-2]
MSLLYLQSTKLDITLRIITAFIGGFITANLLASLIAYYLPSTNTVDNIVAGMMLGFIIWTVVTIYTFATKSAIQAFLCITAVCVISCGWMSYLGLVFKS